MPAHTRGADARHGVPARRQAHDRERRDRRGVSRRVRRRSHQHRRDRVPRADGRLRALPRSQVRPDQSEGFLLADRASSTAPTSPASTRRAAAASRPGRRCRGRTRRPKRSSRRPTRQVRASEAAYAAARAAAARRHGRPGRCAAHARRTTCSRRRGSRSRAALVAYYPFEETSPVPDDQLPQSQAAIAGRPAAARAGNARRGFGGTAGSAARAAPPRSDRWRTGARRRPSGGGRQSGPVAGKAARSKCAQVRTLRSRSGTRLRTCASRSCSRRGRCRVSSRQSSKRRSSGRASRARRSSSTTTTADFLATDVGDFERTEPFSIDLWVLAGPGLRRCDRLQSPRRQQLRQRRLRASAREEQAAVRLHALARRQHDSRRRPDGRLPVKQWTHVTVTYDGSSRAAGIGALCERRARRRRDRQATT